MPCTTTQNTIGATINEISFKNASLKIFRLTAKSGTAIPSTIPSRSAKRTCTNSDVYSGFRAIGATVVIVAIERSLSIRDIQVANAQQIPRQKSRKSSNSGFRDDKATIFQAADRRSALACRVEYDGADDQHRRNILWDLVERSRVFHSKATLAATLCCRQAPASRQASGGGRGISAVECISLAVLSGEVVVFVAAPRDACSVTLNE
jgi:hypothetical protein